MLGRTPQGPFGFTSQNRDITRDICKEDGLGLVGETAGCRDQSPLCPHCLCRAQEKFIHQTFAFPSPCELPSSPLKSQTSTPNILFCLKLRWYLRKGFSHLGELLSFLGYLPYIHLFNFFLLICFLLMQFLGQPDGEDNGTPLQYSCLENPMDGRAW